MEIIKQGVFFILLCGLIVLSGSASAKDEYQTRVGFIYQETDYDSGGKFKALAGQFLYNFSPVKYSNGPYAESDFLYRVPAVAMMVGTVEHKSGSLKLDGDILQLEFSMASQETPFLLNVIYSNTDANGSSYNYDSETIGLQFGYYLDQATAVRLDVEETNTNYAGLGLADTDTRAVRGIAKKVLNLNNGQYLNLQGEIISVDTKGGDMSEFGLHGDFYPDRTFGIGGGVTFNSGDDKDDDGTTIVIDASKFVGEALVIGAVYSQFDSEGNSDSELFLITAAYRF